MLFGFLHLPFGLNLGRRMISLNPDPVPEFTHLHSTLLPPKRRLNLGRRFNLLLKEPLFLPQLLRMLTRFHPPKTGLNLRRGIGLAPSAPRHALLLLRLLLLVLLLLAILLLLLLFLPLLLGDESLASLVELFDSRLLVVHTS